MGILPTTIPQQAESPLITFSFTDVAEGTGIQTFFLANTKEDTTTSYLLTGNEIYSNDQIETVSLAIDTSSFTKFGDFDFDTSVLNLPRNIRGTLSSNLFWSIQKATGFVCQGYIILKLRKWDGTTETEVTSVQSETVTSTQAGVEQISAVQVLVSDTHFKKGDTIRLTVEVWAKNTDPSNQGTIKFGNDPQNRIDDISEGSKSTVYMPFRIDS